MGLRIQLERMQKALFPSISEYAHFFALDQAMLDLAKPDAIVMHPGPCNHGVEMPTLVYDGVQSVIQEQVTNGVAIRMAILYLLTSRRNNP
jgi:aspartate carbamoyltransferase catalytic subunit